MRINISEIGQIATLSWLCFACGSAWLGWTWVAVLVLSAIGIFLGFMFS